MQPKWFERRRDARAALRLEGERLGIAALAFLAADEERIRRFLALTGIEPTEIRSAAAEPGFLAAVLDHLLADEALLLVFAANAGEDPAHVAAARAALNADGETPA